MKLKQLLIEEELKGALIKILNIMLKVGMDPEDISYNYNVLSNTYHITDDEIKSEAVLYYKKYHNIAEEKGTFKGIDVNLEYNEDEIDNEILALAEHLGIHPLLINDDGYGYYSEIIDGEEYRVLEESEAEEEFRERADEYIDETLQNTDDLGWLESYLEIDKYYVESFCEEEADYRVDDMDDETIIEEMGEEDELERRISVARKKQERWHELDNEIVDTEDQIEELTNEIEELNEEMYDLRSSAASSQDRDEIADMENEYSGMKQTMAELQEKLEYWEEHLEEIRYEFDELDDDMDDIESNVTEELAEELKDDLRKKIAEDMYDDIDHEGWTYFSSQLGYTAKQVVDNGWFDIDRDSAIDDLESDRGNIMSSYDGIEYEEIIDNELYYIYRHN
jgi:hypothetical protein